MFDYFSYVDPGIDGDGFQLSSFQANGSAPVRDPGNPNIVTSNGSFTGVSQPGANQPNTILWKAVSSIAPSGQVMNTQFTFTTENGGPLGALRFLQYLDEDVQGAGDDVFLSAGTAASGDLELFTFDNTDVFGLSHSGVLLPGTTDLQNASFTGWAADRFNNMKPLIEGVGQLVSPTGVITNLLSLQHPQLGSVLGPADIVSVLAWDVDPNAASAVITTSLGGIPISAQTVEVRPVGNPSITAPLSGQELYVSGHVYLTAVPGSAVHQSDQGDRHQEGPARERWSNGEGTESSICVRGL